MIRACWRRLALASFAPVMVLSAMAGCGGDKPTQPEPGNCQYSGITRTREDGFVISVDPDDWACPADTGSSGEPVTRLYAAYPNPARPMTAVRFSLGRVEHVTLAILGPPSCDTVRTLVHQEQRAGTHQIVWDGRDAQGSLAPPGVYRCVMTAGTFSCRGDIEIQQAEGRKEDN